MPWSADGTTWTTATGRKLTRAQVEVGEGRGGSGNPFAVEGGAEQLGQSLKSDFGQLGNAAGLSYNQLAPGSTALDTADADAVRLRLKPLLEQLQQQAATGGGAWEDALAKATAQSQASAEALGQSQPGVGYSSALHNIGNAQSEAGQRAVGQGNQLRAKSQLAGRTGLSALLGDIAGQDAAQAAESAAALQGERQANAAAGQAASGRLQGTIKGASQAVGVLAGMSDGGPVPGRPEVFGDDEANDTVPAMLSPGELVIPRSHAGSPEAAADFVRALRAHQGRAQHLADGGEPGHALPGGLQSRGVDFLGPGPQDATRDSGALLDTRAYDAARNSSLANAELLGQSAAGRGPSVAAQRMQSGTDANLAAALQHLAGQRGLPAGDVLHATGAAQQQGAGEMAAGVAGEQQAGQGAFARALLGQRAQDQALAHARQQALFRHQQLNLGLDASQQAAIQNVIGGVGQGVAAYSAAAGGKEKSGGDFSGSDKNAPSYSGGSSSPSEWNPYPYAHGGLVPDDESVRADAFLAALRRKKAA